MINNSITIAEYKLKLHFKNGENSSLTIQEVAELMDLVVFGRNFQNNKYPIFFSLNEN
jgi:hypothetical protein